MLPPTNDLSLLRLSPAAASPVGVERSYGPAPDVLVFPPSVHLSPRPQSCYAATALVLAAATLIGVIYLLPVLLAGGLEHKLLYLETPDDALYEMRVLQIWRGNSLGNPYLAEHADAPRYMPEMVERVLAWAIRATRANPLKFIAVTRALFPALIFIFVYKLARELDLGEAAALFAGSAITLGPSSALGGYALRYFRVISPAAHVCLLIGALWLMARAWRAPSWRNVAVAGVGLGLLFYTPLYYWGFAVCGCAMLALLDARARGALMGCCVIAVMLGLPNLLHSAHIAGDPMVHETLARLGLMVPGRLTEVGVLPRVVIGVLLSGLALWFHKSGFRWAEFTLPLALAATLMLVQNTVTDRQIQAYHMVNCLVPLAGLVLAGFLQATHLPKSIHYGLSILLFAGAVAVQISAYSTWLRNTRSDPAQYAAETAFPNTIAWLNRATPPGSVVVLPQALDNSVPLFTLNHTYYSHYVFQYVVSNKEVELREQTLAEWLPGKALPYRADYVVWQESRCSDSPHAGVVFRSVSEATCIFRVRPEASFEPGSRGQQGQP